MNNIMAEPDSILTDEVLSKLKKIESIHPFQIIYYGSRSRGEENDLSDYNFYLIANPIDQMRPSFIQEISVALDFLDTDSSVSLIAGDLDALIYRVKFFEPTAVHLAELGQIVYGKGPLEQVRGIWSEVKKNPINIPLLMEYMEKRCKFYKDLKSRNTKEDISRIEKVISLNIQLWILTHISDISTTEIFHMDIPARLIAMVRDLYKAEATEDVLILVSIYKELHELKQTVRTALPYPEENLSRIKESISQIQDLSNAIVKTIIPLA